MFSDDNSITGDGVTEKGMVSVLESALQIIWMRATGCLVARVLKADDVQDDRGMDWT